MTTISLFRIVTMEGLLSHDTFVVAPEQPKTIRAGCLLVINNRDHVLRTVHATRLIPAEVVEAGLPIAREVKSACLKCGRVAGVVADQVTCPYHGDGPCELTQSRS